MSDRSNETYDSFGRDVPAPPFNSSGHTPGSIEPVERHQPDSGSVARRRRDSYQPRPLASWLSRLWRTLAFRPGVYTEMMGDRHATWQATTTWIVASIGPAFGVLVYSGPVLTGILQVFLGSVVALVLWSGIVHVASRILSKGDPHSYTQTIRSVGFSMVPGLGLLVVPAIPFSLWGLAMQIQGLREGIGLTWPRAIIVALIPWLLIVGLFVLLLVMACGMGAC